jgi:hypothetical protein
MKKIQSMKYIIIFFAALTLLTSCGSSDKPTNPEPAQEEKHVAASNEVILTDVLKQQASVLVQWR